MEYTPGPWRLHQTSTRAVFAGLPPDEDAVAHVDGGFEDARIANARLIAAAPELLEALRECVDCVTDLVTEAHEDPEVLKKSRAAIAKATGTAG